MVDGNPKGKGTGGDDTRRSCGKLEHARQNGEGNGGALFYFKTNIALRNVNWFMVSRPAGLRDMVKSGSLVAGLPVNGWWSKPFRLLKRFFDLYPRPIYRKPSTDPVQRSRFTDYGSPSPDYDSNALRMLFGGLPLPPIKC